MNKNDKNDKLKAKHQSIKNESEKLNSAITFDETSLSDEVSLKERKRAYEKIALDTERSEAILASVLNAARHGLI